MYRGRTLRKSHIDISGNVSSFQTAQLATTNTFLQFLDANADNAYKRPWHRLERGLRLNRLRKFAEEEAQRFSGDQTQLFQVLSKALDRKLLNSKSVVNYDAEQEKILEIKGLTMHKQASGTVIFSLSERKTGATVKRKPEGQQTNQTT